MRQKHQDLDHSLRDWRQGAETPESFSRVARARILHASSETEVQPAPLSALFLPVRRLALASVLPVLLLSAMFGYLTLPGQSERSAPTGTLTAAKQGNKVIFNIANGHRDHRVLRSDQPDFEAATAFTTSDGSFVDRLQGGPDLVFYRID